MRAKNASLSRTDSLATTTISKLKCYFASRGHNPSDAMWEALTDLATALEAMAEGTSERKFFLSSLDPGVGKTQTIVHFIAALLASPAHKDVGVLLCLSRLSEIERLIDEVGVTQNELAIVTSDPELNARGNANASEARILITTQQMVEKRLTPFGIAGNTSNLADANLFHYQGNPRAVRIWDESFLPGQTITLNRDDAAFLFKPMRSVFPKLTGQIEDLFTTLRGVEDGAIMQLPDFAEDNAVELNEVLGIFSNPVDPTDGLLKEDQRQAISSLWFLSGKMVTIRKDGKYGNTVIDYRDTLPEDLAPMVILDASGRVRDTYRDLEVSRGTLVRLKTAVKRYDPLTLHLWQTGGSKRSFHDNGPRLACGIARTIDTKPSEHWLVVTHQAGGKVGNVEKEILSYLKETSAANVSFTTWGRHSATNAYVDVLNVILAGTLFYRISYYEALKRLAAGRHSASGVVTPEELYRVMMGEHAHLILQALCRGVVRKCDGDKCHPMNAYIIASVRSGIPSSLQSIFPGASIVPWLPIERELKGHVKDAVEFLEGWVRRASPFDTLPFSTTARAIGMSPKDFTKDVRKHDHFMSAIAEMGIVEFGQGRRFTDFMSTSDTLKHETPTGGKLRIRQST